MTTDDDAPAPTAAEKLAALVARRKAAQDHGNGPASRRGTERAAAALSLSKSKPAPRRG
jgi:hypothetical protein